METLSRISNAADMLNRGVEITLLTKFKVWKNGPKWLSSDGKYWPTDDIRRDENEDVIPTLVG